MDEIKVKTTNDLGKSRFWLWKARLAAKIDNFKQAHPAKPKAMIQVHKDGRLTPA